jgi:MFS family permease
LLMALIAFRLVTSLSPEQFAEWGWRLPFLFSGVLMMIGLAIRFGVQESPEFKAIADKGETVQYPVLEVIRTCWRQILFAAAAVTIGSAGFFFTNTFMITYVTQYQGIARSTILDCLFLVTVIQFISQPISALLAERIGEGRFLKLAALLSMLVPYPMFLLVGTQNIVLMTLGIAMAVVVLSGLYAVIAGYMAQAFPAHLRYSGISIAYQLICAIAGGSTPIIGTLLASHYAGQWMPLAIFFSLLAALSLIGVCGLARLRGESYATAPQFSL